MAIERNDAKHKELLEYVESMATPVRACVRACVHACVRACVRA